MRRPALSALRTRLARRLGLRRSEVRVTTRNGHLLTARVRGVVVAHDRPARLAFAARHLRLGDGLMLEVALADGERPSLYALACDTAGRREFAALAREEWADGVRADFGRAPQ